MEAETSRWSHQEAGISGELVVSFHLESGRMKPGKSQYFSGSLPAGRSKGRPEGPGQEGVPLLMEDQPPL